MVVFLAVISVNMMNAEKTMGTVYNPTESTKLFNNNLVSMITSHAQR